ncbi:MAG TPA: ABC transporter substrate-binding protein [Tissierellaceae bacterium]
MYKSYLRFFVLLLVLIFLFSAAVGCTKASETEKKDSTETTKTSNDNEKKDSTEEITFDPNNPTKISFLNGKPEIINELQEACEAFSRENPGIVAEALPAESGKSPYQTLTVMYNAGNAPSLFMIEQGDVLKVADKVLDLSGERFINDTIEAALKPVTTEDGKVCAAPFAVESVGFVYNKKVIEEAIGQEFDPNTIKTISDLENIFKQLEAKGIAPIAISREDWSLGAHYMMYMYAHQFPNSEKNQEFTEDLRQGKIDLINNKIFNGWLDTFDLMKKYNIHKNDPLAGNTDKDAALLTSGEVAFWFMGTFMWPVMERMGANPSDFGLMPIPVSDDPSYEANTRLLSVYTMYLGVDKEQNSLKQQAAAKKFIDWLLYSETGQDYVINKMQIVPAYTHITLEQVNPLNKSLVSYINANRFLDFNIIYPSDHWQVLGGSMQKYLADAIDREGLAKEIETYWANLVE